eukprot:CAMPEP_0117020780 /NCGR_PEP_ID=MMETSP0472-20121206/15759_1 /TAXON_ID=693140 ORGANISM="Tiarina fusus, Strain LIS" /NCGR_SAMPLE_ID=MMETSP0472 /ASSEMBLY_ACC=CAM_ASM_000603 /LENGTH=117 /DNA_ID=CAMNT_0004726089 /DNA_START=39 /DNA_END=392 /DNA_ORIENTATION=-
MAAVAKKGGRARDSAPSSRIRITLTSRNVKSVEKVCEALKANAKQANLSVRGPVRLPTKVLTVTTRKSCSGNGTATFDRFGMKIHKRLLDVVAPADVITRITSVVLDPGVDLVLTAI